MLHTTTAIGTRRLAAAQNIKAPLGFISSMREKRVCLRQGVEGKHSTDCNRQTVTVIFGFCVILVQKCGSSGSPCAGLWSISPLWDSLVPREPKNSWLKPGSDTHPKINRLVGDYHLGLFDPLTVWEAKIS
jgi:hypothetical protein